jgi:predicted porin
MGAARLQWQVVKLHVCVCRCPAAAAGSQTAVTVMQWQDTKLHAQMRTATLLQRVQRVKIQNSKFNSKFNKYNYYNIAFIQLI